MSEQLGKSSHADAITSFVGAVQQLVAAEAERDQAWATIAKVRAIVFEPGASFVVERIRAALEGPGR